jgi:hypothetical protein
MNVMRDKKAIEDDFVPENELKFWENIVSD